MDPITQQTNIIEQFALMSAGDYYLAMRDLMLFDTVSLKKTYNKDGVLVKCEYLHPTWVPFYPEGTNAGKF